MFSIVVPVLGKAHTIRRTLDSVFAQDFAGFELVLVGEELDSGMAIAGEFGDPRLRRVFHRNIGQGDARNVGIEAARHEWIAFLDADDLWLPDHLTELDAIRQRFPEAGLIGTRFIHSDRSGRFDLAEVRTGDIELGCFFDEIGRGENFLCTSSAAIPRTSYDRLGGFGNSPSGEDTEYWARIALELPVAASRRPTVVYMHGTGGITDTATERWRNADLASPRDISPPVALVMDRYPGVESRRLRRSLDRFIRHYLGICLLSSISIGDIATVRRLRRIYRGWPTPAHAILLAISFLPDKAARAFYAFASRLKAGWRRTVG